MWHVKYNNTVNLMNTVFVVYLHDTPLYSLLRSNTFFALAPVAACKQGTNKLHMKSCREWNWQISFLHQRHKHQNMKEIIIRRESYLADNKLIREFIVQWRQVTDINRFTCGAKCLMFPLNAHIADTHCLIHFQYVSSCLA